MKSCSFTGHRNVEKHHLQGIFGLLDRAISYAYNEGCRDFFVGGALGFDTLAAKQVILFRIHHPDVKLHVIIPCKTQADSWSSSQVRTYEYILGMADTVECLSDTYTTECMRARNQRLVDLADVVIAYVSRYNSGAAQTVRMAQRAGKKVYNLYPALNE